METKFFDIESDIKKYENIAMICGIVGIISLFFSMAFFVWLVISKTDLWWLAIPSGIIVIAMFPMIFYSEKSFKLQVNSVKNKSEKELDEWLLLEKNRNREEYIEKILTSAGYEKKWVKIEHGEVV